MSLAELALTIQNDVTLEKLKAIRAVKSISASAIKQSRLVGRLYDVEHDPTLPQDVRAEAAAILASWRAAVKGGPPLVKAYARARPKPLSQTRLMTRKLLTAVAPVTGSDLEAELHHHWVGDDEGLYREHADRMCWALLDKHPKGLRVKGLGAHALVTTVGLAELRTRETVDNERRSQTLPTELKFAPSEESRWQDTDMFTCQRCNSTRTKFRTQQTRSADESQTVFHRCNAPPCTHYWST